jgi:16S rRNA (adenine1518-N6/adenine1519-N6)-dimethyltransferase
MARRFGQHFLARKSILDRIADAACATLTAAGSECEEAAGKTGRPTLVIEIGPGKGALTESLLARADQLIAIEVDTYLVHYLRQKFAAEIDQGRLTLIEGDVLKTDLTQWGPAVVAGNLPYYITSPILEKLFTMGDSWTRAVFLMQKEVAERLTAQPGTRDFGYLSVQTQLFANPEILFEVARAAFRPPPKVDSAVIRLEHSGRVIEDRAAFLKFASAAFRHKRKTLRNNLAPLYGKDRVDALPEAKQRAEQLSLDALLNLFERLR